MEQVQKGSADRILVVKTEGKRPLGRSRWENSNEIVLKETGYEGVDKIQMAQGRDQWRAVVNTATNLRAA